MSIMETVKTRMKDAMRSKDASVLSTMRLIMAMVKEKEIQARAKEKEITEDDVISGLRSMIKSRRDSIKMYIDGGRQELADKEQAEIDAIESLLPKGLNEDEMEKAINDAIAEVKATSIKDMGKVIGKLKAKFGAVLDMSVAGPMVKARLNQS